MQANGYRQATEQIDQPVAIFGLSVLKPEADQKSAPNPRMQ